MRAHKKQRLSSRSLIILIILLLCASPLIYWQRWAIPGITFIYTMTSMICLALALFLATFLPWRKPGLLKLSRALRWCYLAGSLFVVVSFIIAQTAIWRFAAQAQEREPDADCLLVLGAGLYGETPSLILQTRLNAALDYLYLHPESVAVLSGGQGSGETVSEASAMRLWLMANGIEGARLHLEELATSTGENIAFSQPIIAGLGYDRAVVVTNDFHLLRASLLAAHYGLDAQMLGAPTPAYFLVPFSSYAREYLALVKDWLLLNFYPQRLSQNL